MAFEAAQLLRSPVWRGEGVERGYGRPVLLVPGFLAGDGTLGTMAKWLRDNGYWTRRAGIRSNIDCSEKACDLIEERLEALAGRTGRRVAIIGQSRGGVLARAVAVRRPDLVSGIVTLGSPQKNPTAVHPLVRAQVYAVGVLGTLGARGLFRRSCLWGDCCKSFWEELAAPLPKGVGYVSIYSRSDGVVDWRACLDEGAQHVEVSASHCGMAVSVGTYQAVAEALESFRDAGRGPARRPRAGRRAQPQGFAEAA